MENYSGISVEEESMELPPGFRFHPTDEELITHYLSPKVLNSNFNALAIGEADFNKVEPWDLPRKAKVGEKEWYFFCVRDRKYPTGLRTNRATEAGYWKATGKDKEIFRAKSLIGMKKTLVFYTGRAPKGEKTSWVMHEYRLDGKFSKHNLPKTAKNEWVLSRVFKKSSGVKKPNLQGFVSLEELHPPLLLPPLTETSSSPYNNSETKATMIGHPSHVTCFSSHPSAMEDLKKSTKQEEEHRSMIDNTITNTNYMLENTLIMEQSMADFQYTDSIFMQDQSILKLLLEGKGSNILSPSNAKAELSQETGLSVGDVNIDIMSPISNHDQMVQNSAGPIDLDCLWDY